jgi:hypothetical protein
MQEYRPAATVLLQHPPKSTANSQELTIENMIRGSGDLGAFLTSCWATRLQVPSEPYTSPSFLMNVKQRDFESEPFEVVSDPPDEFGERSGRLRMVGTPGSHVTLQVNGASIKPGDTEAKAIVAANLDKTVPQIMELLRAAGHIRAKTWTTEARIEARTQQLVQRQNVVAP